MTAPHITEIDFGIAKLDQELGPLAPGQLCLVSGGADTGKSIFCMNFLHSGLARGETVGWVVPDSPEQALARADHAGFDLRGYTKTNHLILLHQKTQSTGLIHSLDDMTPLMEALDEQILPWEPTRLVIDSALPIIALFGREFRRAGVSAFVRHLLELGVTLVMTTRMPASSEAVMLRKNLEEISSCSIHLDEQRTPSGESNRRLVVRKRVGLEPPYPVYQFVIESGKGMVISDRTQTPLDSPKEEVKLARHAKHAPDKRERALFSKHLKLVQPEKELASTQPEPTPEGSEPSVGQQDGVESRPSPDSASEGQPPAVERRKEDRRSGGDRRRKSVFSFRQES